MRSRRTRTGMPHAEERRGAGEEDVSHAERRSVWGMSHAESAEYAENNLGRLA